MNQRGQASLMTSFGESKAFAAAWTQGRFLVRVAGI
jgi:hypothetical protein